MNIITSYTEKEVISIIQHCINIRDWESKVECPLDYRTGKPLPYINLYVFNRRQQAVATIMRSHLKDLGKMDIENLLYKINESIIHPLERRMR